MKARIEVFYEDLDKYSKVYETNDLFNYKFRGLKNGAMRPRGFNIVFPELGVFGCKEIFKLIYELRTSMDVNSNMDNITFQISDK